jgi:hypothetical protein
VLVLKAAPFGGRMLNAVGCQVTLIRGLVGKLGDHACNNLY